MNGEMPASELREYTVVLIRKRWFRPIEVATVYVESSSFKRAAEMGERRRGRGWLAVAVYEGWDRAWIRPTGELVR